MKQLSKETVTAGQKLCQVLIYAMYKLDDETAVTLYKDGIPIEDIEREKRNAMETMKLDIPTLFSFDVVNVDGNNAIIYEHFKYTHMSSLIMAHPENFNTYVADFTDLAHLMHRTHVKPGTFRPVTGMYDTYLTELESQQIFTASEVAAARRMMAAIPERDTYAHMDYQPLKVLCGKEETMVYEMLLAGSGHPIYDLSATALCTILVAQNYEEDVARMITNMDRATCVRFFKAYIRRYFRCETDADAVAMEQRVLFAALLKYMVMPVILPDLEEERISVLQGLCRKAFFPRIDAWIEGMKPVWARFE